MSLRLPQPGRTGGALGTLLVIQNPPFDTARLDTFDLAKLGQLDDAQGASAINNQNQSEPPKSMPAATQSPQTTQARGYVLNTGDVKLEKTNLTRELRLPLDEDNDVEIRFFGQTFGMEQLESLADVVDLLKKNMARKSKRLDQGDE